MRIAIPKESRAGETRVAAVPETVKKFVILSAGVSVETGAGLASAVTDAAYAAAGATLADGFAATVAGADVVLKIAPPTEAEVALLTPGQKLFCTMQPYGLPEVLKACAERGVEAFAMEFMPRISRAQSMDVLSSQSNLAGYRAVIEGAAAYGRAMPQMMTAAGTIAPCRCFVMGVGVAGLQAIATARRLGALVTATDVRPVTEEQVASLGAKFIAVKNEEFLQAQTAGGYAREMSAEYKRLQAELVVGHIARQDMVITTALIPGRKAPILVTAAMVASMRTGSVLVDLAVEQGGNIEGARAGETVVTENGVIILGIPNMAGRMAADASALYARNHLNFLAPYFGKDGFALDEADELVKGIRLTRGGAVVHPNFAAPNLAAKETA